MRRTTLTVALAGSVAALSCVSPLESDAAKAGERHLDAKLANATWIEDGKLVALIVSSRATAFRLKRPYVPIEVSVANRGLAGLTLSRESFTLADARGHRYPLAGRKELESGYGGSFDLDRRMFSEAAGIVAAKFITYSQVASNFNPGFEEGIGLDRVVLPRFSYLVDFLYFPTPAEYTAGEPLELRLTAPELKDPVFVRFTVPATH